MQNTGRAPIEKTPLGKPRVYELQDNGSYSGGRVKPLDSGVIEEMVEIARRIAHDYEHGFEGVGDEGVCRDYVL